MRIPLAAYKAIEESIANSVSAEFDDLSDQVGLPQPPEARAIMQRMHMLVAGATPCEDDQWVDMSIAFFSEDDISCLLGIITGLYLTYGVINRSMQEVGDIDHALEAAGMARSLGVAGGIVLKARNTGKN